MEADGKKIPLGQRKLACDDECAEQERKRILAIAFGITLINPLSLSSFLFMPLLNSSLYPLFESHSYA